MAIERDLHDLLFAHDCVIVPRFGGFLTHYRPARLDEQRNTVHPPGKDVSFNRHLVRTDGLLSHQVAQNEGIDFVGANAVIDGEVDAWQSKLNRNGRLELPRIGTFYRDAEKNLQFDPDKRVNFLKNAYGLRSVAAVPVISMVPKPVPKVIALPPIKPAPVEEREPRRMPLLLTAAAVVAICSTVGTWWLVSRNSPDGAQWSGFDLFSAREPVQYVMRNEEPAPLPNMDDTIRWIAPENEYGVNVFPIAGADGPSVMVDLGQAPKQVPIEVKPQPAAPVSTAVATSTTHSRFHIIGGCFLIKDNADTFVANLQAKGFAATIIDQKGGLYRVAYGSYPDRALAQEALSAVRKELAPEAWMLVK